MKFLKDGEWATVCKISANKETNVRISSGGILSGDPVTKTPHFQCMGPGFDSWLEN